MPVAPPPKNPTDPEPPIIFQVFAVKSGSPQLRQWESVATSP